MSNNLTLQRIEEIFENRRPGAVGRYKYFSILVPVVEHEGALHLLYEVRSDDLKRQPGEICFPGGEMEGGETAGECALRETVEELGVCFADIRLISQLDSLHTYSNFTMYCFLGVIDAAAYEACIPNADEVKETFLVPVSWFLEHDPYVYNMEVIPDVGEDFPYELIKFGNGYNWRKGKTEVPIYHFKERVIWGLTARITHNLAKILREGSSI